MSASHGLGLILPGMMDEPGSFSGILSSTIATLGPLAYQRTSLTIFINAPASLRTLRPRRAQTVPRSCSLQTQMVDGSLQRSDGSDFAEAGMSVDARADCRSSAKTPERACRIPASASLSCATQEIN